MFLDLRDPWPQVPPPSPSPEPTQPRLSKRAERIIGLLVAINLALLLIIPVAGGTIVRAVAAAWSAIQR